MHLRVRNISKISGILSKLGVLRISINLRNFCNFSGTVLKNFQEAHEFFGNFRNF
jgi:hypothetical protein